MPKGKGSISFYKLHLSLGLHRISLCAIYTTHKFHKTFLVCGHTKVAWVLGLRMSRGNVNNRIMCALDIRDRTFSGLLRSFVIITTTLLTVLFVIQEFQIEWTYTMHTQSHIPFKILQYIDT